MLALGGYSHLVILCIKVREWQKRDASPSVENYIPFSTPPISRGLARCRVIKSGLNNCNRRQVLASSILSVGSVLLAEN